LSARRLLRVEAKVPSNTEIPNESGHVLVDMAASFFLLKL